MVVCTCTHPHNYYVCYDCQALGAKSKLNSGVKSHPVHFLKNFVTRCRSWCDSVTAVHCALVLADCSNTVDGFKSILLDHCRQLLLNFKTGNSLSIKKLHNTALSFCIFAHSIILNSYKNN